MAELKKCPFCGGEATPVYCENGNRYTSNILHLSKRGTIKCKKCELTLPRVYSKVSKAIEAWNNRTTESEIRAKDGGWIPCSERYPEEAEFVLVYDSKHNVIDIAEFLCPHWEARWGKMDEEITAWQPLPAPYQKGE